MNNEGYIKFSPNWQKAPIEIDPILIDEINRIRSLLIRKGWLGILPNGVGFGNISVRQNPENSFLITGSATGHFKNLDKSHFAIVNKVNIASNKLDCVGLTLASSESMTHAVFYENRKAINTVIHIHSRKLWLEYINRLPTSDKNAQYGTPEMAASILSILKTTNTTNGLFVMGGHEDGLIAFGENIDLAYGELSNLI